MAEFPVIEDFTIDGLPWAFKDIKSLDDLIKVDVMSKLLVNANAAEDDSTREDRTQVACSDYIAEKEAANQRFAALQEANPRYTAADFERDGGLVFNEVCPRPGIPGSIIVAMNRGGPVGGIALTNIVVERSRDGILRANIQPGPGLPAIRGSSMMKVWGIALRWILANEIPLENSQTLDVVEWVLPETPRFWWNAREHSELSEMFSEIETVADRENNTEDAEAPRKFRRKNADAD